MLNFIETNKDKLIQFLSKFNEDDVNRIAGIIGDAACIAYAEVDGSVILRIGPGNVNCAFTFPLGDGWQSVIAFLITYTREYYLPLRFIGVKMDDLVKLLTMFPNYSPQITGSDHVNGTYDICL